MSFMVLKVVWDARSLEACMFSQSRRPRSGRNFLMGDWEQGCEELALALGAKKIEER